MQLRPQDILESVRHLIEARDLAGLASYLDTLIVYLGVATTLLVGAHA